MEPSAIERKVRRVRPRSAIVSPAGARQAAPRWHGSFSRRIKSLSWQVRSPSTSPCRGRSAGFARGAGRRLRTGGRIALDCSMSRPHRWTIRKLVLPAKKSGLRNVCHGRQLIPRCRNFPDSARRQLRPNHAMEPTANHPYAPISLLMNAIRNSRGGSSC